ncbi:hypothetical protein ACUN24_25175 [Pedobacter sp. WC2501]|uniref:hypothetical protein n=1 Tax=Pedobacter sp. WC2501 TaxID=3461400 RepID=UPI00404660C2
MDFLKYTVANAQKESLKQGSLKFQTFDFANKKFTSFNQVANEAAISRLYGGIHYRLAIENGQIQGRNIGVYQTGKVIMKKD